MKQVYIGLFLCSAFFPIQSSRAQSAQSADQQNKLIRYNYPEQHLSSNVPLNEVSSRAYKYFLKNFPDVKNEVWIQTEEGCTAYFHDEQQVVKLFFNTRGGFNYSEKTYGVIDFSSELKGIVMNRFPSYIIGTVKEINDGLRDLYEVQISNAEKSKVLVIRNNDIEISSEYVN